MQGIGIQQHSNPPQSIHFVFPAALLSGLTMEPMVEEAAEPGPLRSTRVWVEVHILLLESRVLALLCVELGFGRRTFGGIVGGQLGLKRFVVACVD